MDQRQRTTSTTSIFGRVVDERGLRRNIAGLARVQAIRQYDKIAEFQLTRSAPEVWRHRLREALALPSFNQVTP